MRHYLRRYVQLRKPALEQPGHDNELIANFQGVACDIAGVGSCALYVWCHSARLSQRGVMIRRSEAFAAGRDRVG